MATDTKAPAKGQESKQGDSPKDEGVTPAAERVEKAAEVQEAQAAAKDTGADTDERKKLAQALLADTKPPEVDASPKELKALSAKDQKAADQALVDAALERLKADPSGGFKGNEVAAMQRLRGTSKSGGVAGDKPKRVVREKGFREGTFEHFDENLVGALVFVQVEAPGHGKGTLWKFVDRFDDDGFYEAVQDRLKKSRAYPDPDEATILTLRSRSSRISRPKAAVKAEPKEAAEPAKGDDKGAAKDAQAKAPKETAAAA